MDRRRVARISMTARPIDPLLSIEPPIPDIFDPDLLDGPEDQEDEED